MSVACSRLNTTICWCASSERRTACELVPRPECALSTNTFHTTTPFSFVLFYVMIKSSCCADGPSSQVLLDCCTTPVQSYCYTSPVQVTHLTIIVHRAQCLLLLLVVCDLPGHVNLTHRARSANLCRLWVSHSGRDTPSWG